MLSSQLSVDSVACRICHEDGNFEELVEPCECSGTVALIHVSCLEKWLTTSNTRSCEICKHKFSLQTLNKPIMQSIQQWLNIKSNCRGLIVDMICILVLTFLFIAGMYLCYIGVIHFTHLRNWESTIILTLSIVLITVYFIWLAITIRYHLQSWKQWHKKNKDIKLLVAGFSNTARLQKKQFNVIQRSVSRNDGSSSGLNHDDNNVNINSNGVNNLNRFRLWYHRFFNTNQDLHQPTRETLV
ncbi:E3 ubiquitin-protein ligase MARCHF2-like [Microplitis mediator]|uniref:E3 ubiquitin-protein ligase MARCHF2-like n=1 Tax=Microplitis mediator TaxID=375433 RepID=UPI002555A221|nr:E3 ubiquitin-protein ligase MARCHF2-like [Microplitis mediator]